MGALTVKTSAAEGRMLATLDSLRSTRSKYNDARRSLDQLEPVVTGAHPVRLAVSTQGAALVHGVLSELLPDHPAVTGGKLATAATLTGVGAWYARPDVVAMGQGFAAPEVSELGRALVRALKGWGRAPATEAAGAAPAGEVS